MKTKLFGQLNYFVRHYKRIFIILIGILLCIGTLPLAIKYGYGFLFGVLGGTLFSLSGIIALKIDA